jgi:hypothetical protein
MKTTIAQLAHRATIHEQAATAATGATLGSILRYAEARLIASIPVGEAQPLDPIAAALDRLTIARDMLQLTVEQLDDPLMLYLVEDLSIIMQRLESLSQRIGD